MTLAEAFSELIWHENASWSMNISVQNMLAFRQRLINGKPIPKNVMEKFLIYCHYRKTKDGSWFLPPTRPIIEIDI